MALADQAVLAEDTTFISRVRSAMVAGCVVISNEAESTANHWRRTQFAATIINNPETYKLTFAIAIATDSNVINDATQANTVTVTTGNVAAQAALVTDAHINTGAANVYKAFFSPV